MTQNCDIQSLSKWNDSNLDTYAWIKVQDSKAENYNCRILEKNSQIYKLKEFTFTAGHPSSITSFWFNKRNSTHRSNRLQCWSILLLNYDFKLEYDPFKNLVPIDSLSILKQMLNCYFSNKKWKTNLKYIRQCNIHIVSYPGSNTNRSIKELLISKIKKINNNL